MGVIDIYNKIGNTNELEERTLVDAIKNSSGGSKEWVKAFDLTSSDNDKTTPTNCSELLLVMTNSSGRKVINTIPTFLISDTDIELNYNDGGATCGGKINSTRVHNSFNSSTMTVYYR